MNKMLVNVAGTMGARYLLVSVSVVGTASDFKHKMVDHDAQLRDMACGDLATKTLADLENPEPRNVIRSELISGFNNILGDSDGAGHLFHRICHPVNIMSELRRSPHTRECLC